MITIENTYIKIHITFFTRETPFKVSGKVIHKYFSIIRTVEIKFIIFFIQDNTTGTDTYIFFGALPLPVYGSQTFAGSVKENNVAIGRQKISGYYKFIADSLYISHRNDIFPGFQRNIFHVKKVLKGQFLFGITF